MTLQGLPWPLGKGSLLGFSSSNPRTPASLASVFQMLRYARSPPTPGHLHLPVPLPEMLSASSHRLDSCSSS